MSLKKRLYTLVLCLCLPIFLSLAWSAEALEPDEILVLANGQERAGVDLARFYMQQRNIPSGNLLIIYTAANEGIPRYYYDDEIAEPVREFLEDKPAISCLLLFYGMPLRIDGHGLIDENSKEREGQVAHRQRDSVASVDSELSMVRVQGHPVADWIQNPFFLQFQTQKTEYKKQQVLMVARLDGPDEQIVRRLITDSLEVEKKGLVGTAYFDARWPQPEEPRKLRGYRLYDNAIHEAAKNTQKLLPTIIDEQTGLFQAGEATSAALYCGWYSHANYVDAFDWQQGAVAYHIASSECTTLKKEGSQVWCKRLLEEGVAATIGPVAEPYVQAFPFSQIFFGLLLDGDFTLVEAYFLSLPYLSWKMVLIGDPLYQPFRMRGVLP
jgi:uncharacterized protein (TIGR03790 family)